MRTRAWGTAAIAVVLLFAGTAVADPGAEQQAADKALAEAEATLEAATEAAREAGRTLAEIEDKLPAAHDRVNTARGTAAAAKIVAAHAVDAAEAARADHQKAEGDYDAAAAEVDEARTDLNELAIRSYQHGDLVAFGAILDANNPIEAVGRASWFNEITRRQDSVIDEVVRLRQDARNAENHAEVTSDAAAETETEANEALLAARDGLDEAQSAADDLEDLVKAKRDALRIAKDERGASLKRYEQAEKESERIAAALRTAGAEDEPASPSAAGDTPVFQMPVAGWKSSDFGDRYDPYYHVRQLHAGVDFAAEGGAPISAAAAGTVTEADWSGGYGNYTCIYHGENLSTCYAHQSRILVSVGQKVDQGEHIGDVGTTGASTGSHLHFEVRVKGEPVQPLEWLPECLC